MPVSAGILRKRAKYNAGLSEGRNPGEPPGLDLKTIADTGAERCLSATHKVCASGSEHSERGVAGDARITDWDQYSYA